jgi:hypothetical protein
MSGQFFNGTGVPVGGEQHLHQRLLKNQDGRNRAAILIVELDEVLQDIDITEINSSGEGKLHNRIACHVAARVRRYLMDLRLNLAHRQANFADVFNLGQCALFINILRYYTRLIWGVLDYEWSPAIYTCTGKIHIGDLKFSSCLAQLLLQDCRCELHGHRIFLFSLSQSKSVVGKGAHQCTRAWIRGELSDL